MKEMEYADYEAEQQALADMEGQAMAEMEEQERLAKESEERIEVEDKMIQNQEETQEEMQARFLKEADEEMKAAKNQDKEIDISVETIFDKIEKEEVSKMESNVGQFEFICNQYKQANKAIDSLNSDFNTETEQLTAEINKLNKQLSDIKSTKYSDKLNVLNQEKEELKAKILEEFPKDQKTVKFEFGDFTNKVLKSVVVTDQDVLIAELTDKKLLNKAVKSFDTKMLQIWIEANVLDNGAKIEEKNSLAFKSKGDD